MPDDSLWRDKVAKKARKPVWLSSSEWVQTKKTSVGSISDLNLRALKNMKPLHFAP